MRTPLSIGLAAEIFREVWGDQYLLGDIAQTLNCAEFEALADMLLAVGVDPQTVEEFEQLHVAGDEPDDWHNNQDNEDID
jgi:hypothetical protein